MADSKNSKVEEFPNLVCDLVAQRQPEMAESLAAFMRQYLAQVSFSESMDKNADAIYHRLLAHWQLAAQLPKDTSAKILVFNPQPDTHGWKSSHSIVQLVTSDDPFLFDSLTMAINRAGYSIHRAMHPVLAISRTKSGDFRAATTGKSEAGDDRLESFIHFEIDRDNDEAGLVRLQKSLLETIGQVHAVVADFDTMKQRLQTILSGEEQNSHHASLANIDESCAFLHWLLDDNFIFLGYREHLLQVDNGEDRLAIVADTSLGILRNSLNPDSDESYCRSFSNLPPEIRLLARIPELLVITRSGSESRIHRPGYMDYIGIRMIDDEGVVIGEHRFLGLYTSMAYTRETNSIPIIRRKVGHVLAASGSKPNSHTARTLTEILENYPRDEMFQISEDELLRHSLGILQLQERQKTTLFIRKDPYGRFYSCLVYIPRDMFDTRARLTISDLLLRRLQGESIKFSVKISESPMARAHFIVPTLESATTPPDADSIAREIIAAIRPWNLYLQDALTEHCGDSDGNRLFRQFGEGFRADYRESYTAANAVDDILRMQSMTGPGDIAMDLFQVENDLRLHFKLFNFGQPVPLSNALPMLENMGLRVIEEHPSIVHLPEDKRIWIHDFSLQHSESEIALDHLEPIFQDAFSRIFSGEVANDGFNRLVMRAGLGSRRINILRTYASYLRQLRGIFSLEYISQALVSNAAIATLLIELFETRFEPSASESRQAEMDRIELAIIAALESVNSLDEDRIIRSFCAVIKASIRTNYYQLDAAGNPKNHIAIKFDCSRVPDMPEPRPSFEIFVYSTRFEGIHLRGGAVARGGLRWSDRAEDFRTEVLGLVKAQMVKNAVIVPTGSKGGFIAKQLPADGNREQVLAEGIACYRLFISSLLDLTDNILADAIHPPSRVVRYDADDPYLVVAADKGTATFSDIANEVAADYGFWLDDAFASGGSVGYDHKAMGITARGAWESVKRHFRELGLDTERDPFRVIGVGDMAGDVFGNGMLLSRKIKLVAAFNHQNIFLDPDPDCEASFHERQRLFRLSRSSWEDYDPKLISAGGGIYRRSAKKIPLSSEVRDLLGLQQDSIDPVELIRCLLKAPVDLLWNGGIGTYVKASHQQHADVGDRANDGLRIDGRELRCKVFAEGGNLGLTQPGRIEFARLGGHIYTDAIDNSAGVDCSDHEVNIKILLNSATIRGELEPQKRNDLLAAMTGEVAMLVLRNNYLQTLALGLAVFHAPKLMQVHARLIRQMEHRGILRRRIEFLPDEETITERINLAEGLSSPELAVLLAYAKIRLYEDLVASRVPDDPFLDAELVEYFPSPLKANFSLEMKTHRLRREIIATVLANNLVNRGGITFMFRLLEESGASVQDVASAYVVSREMLGLEEIWSAIEALDGQVSAQTQMMIYLETRKLLERATKWLLKNQPSISSIQQVIDHYQPMLRYLSNVLLSRQEFLADPGVYQKCSELQAAGIAVTLAQRISSFDALSYGLDLIEIAISGQFEIESVIDVHYRLQAKLQIDWLRNRISELPRDTHWQSMARGMLRDELLGLHKKLTREVLEETGFAADDSRDLLASKKVRVERYLQIIAELRLSASPDLTMITVVLRELGALLNRSADTTEDSARADRALTA